MESIRRGGEENNVISITEYASVVSSAGLSIGLATMFVIATIKVTDCKCHSVLPKQLVGA